MLSVTPPSCENESTLGTSCMPLHTHTWTHTRTHSYTRADPATCQKLENVSTPGTPQYKQREVGNKEGNRSCLIVTPLQNFSFYAERKANLTLTESVMKMDTNPQVDLHSSGESQQSHTTQVTPLSQRRTSDTFTSAGSC